MNITIILPFFDGYFLDTFSNVRELEWNYFLRIYSWGVKSRETITTRKWMFAIASRAIGRSENVVMICTLFWKVSNLKKFDNNIEDLFSTKNGYLDWVIH